METAIVTTNPVELWIQVTAEEPIRELSQIPEQMAAGLVSKFLPYAQQVGELAAMAHGIEVTDEADTAGMAEARRLRLAMKAVRVETDKLRKSEKEYALVVGKAVDGLGRVIRERAEVVEARLEEAEKFAERMEAKRREALAAERADILRPICDDVSGFDLAGMTPEAFERLRGGLQAAHDQAEQRAHEQRMLEAEIAMERQREQERIRAENEALRAENERQRAEVAAQQAEAARLAAELKAKADAEAAAARAAREAERAAAIADDVEKMRALYRQIEAIKMPEVAPEYDETLLEVAGRLQMILAYIAEQMRRTSR